MWLKLNEKIIIIYFVVRLMENEVNMRKMCYKSKGIKKTGGAVK